MSTTRPSKSDSSPGIWDGFQSDPASFDEFRSADGQPRSHWKEFCRQTEDFGTTGLSERSHAIKQLMRENGTTFLARESDQDLNRPWQLSVIPYLIDPSSWQVLSEGLQQRARLLEMILADLFGQQRLISERVIPGELIWGNPVFHRAYHTLTPNTQNLHITATDVVRLPDGGWCVTGDRTRAPSGLGYLLENRILTGRMLPGPMRGCNTHRLAEFFEHLRENLRSLASDNRSNPRVAILTPPSGNYREFEDDYLARYLGLTLVRGSDLAVRGGKLHLKTLGGLLPIEVLWRHVSDRRCDPLELDPTSTEGVTGMLRCIRNGSVAIANSVGSVLAQTPGLMPYLSQANEFFFGNPLELNSVTRYWCGDRTQFGYVLANLDSLIFMPAFAVSAELPVDPRKMSAEQRQTFLDQLRAAPGQFVAQEHIAYSTTPVWADGRINARKVTLRVFQQFGQSGIEMLPGGLTRVGLDELELSRSPVSGQLTQDCWVTSDATIDTQKTLLLNDHDKIELRRGGDELPSRVAEHLYWLGRYVERAEGIARTFRTTLESISGEDNWNLLDEVNRLIYSLASMGQIEPGFAVESLSANLPHIESSIPVSVLDREQPRGLLKTMDSVMFNATAVRDRLSTDALRIIRRASEQLRRPVEFHTTLSTGVGQSEQLGMGEAIERVGTLIVDLLAFSGVISESFVRSHAWQFMDLGRRIERASHTSELLIHALCPPTERTRAVCESLLAITDSLMTYRSRYLNLVQIGPTVDLIVTDETNPRSVRFQLDRVATLIDEIPSVGGAVGLDVVQRRVLDLRHRVTVSDPEVLSEAAEDGSLSALRELLTYIVDELPALSDSISARYLIHTESHQLTGMVR